jgi:uncharacterized protein
MDAHGPSRISKAMVLTSLVTICLPTRNLVAAARFYREGLGLPYAVDTADGELPEPVAFALNDGAHLMLIPTGGFGWVAGGHAVANPGVSECIVDLTFALAADVDELVERARAAGGTIVREGAIHDWGYSATFEDLDGHLWMATVTPHA